MNYIDIIILCITLFFAIRGFINGLIKELASTFAIVAGVYLAIFFSNRLCLFFKSKDWINPETVEIASFVIIFFGVLIFVFIFSKILDKFASIIKIQWLNKLAGTLFGIAKSIIIIGGVSHLIIKIAQAIKPSAIIFNDSKLFGCFTDIFKNIFGELI